MSHLFEPIPADVREALRLVLHGSWQDRDEDTIREWLEGRRQQRKDDKPLPRSAVNNQTGAFFAANGRPQSHRRSRRAGENETRGNSP